MHTTTIRNENAYYSCIDQLMAYQKEVYLSLYFVFFLRYLNVKCDI